MRPVYLSTVGGARRDAARATVWDVMWRTMRRGAVYRGVGAVMGHAVWTIMRRGAVYRGVEAAVRGAVGEEVL